MEIYNTSSSQYENENSKTFSMIKIYAFMALALLITGLVGYGLPYLLVATGAEAAYLPIMHDCICNCHDTNDDSNTIKSV